jgi:hypothetical protein
MRLQKPVGEQKHLTLWRFNFVKLSLRDLFRTTEQAKSIFLHFAKVSKTTAGYFENRQKHVNKLYGKHESALTLQLAYTYLPPGIKSNFHVTGTKLIADPA